LTLWSKYKASLEQLWHHHHWRPLEVGRGGAYFSFESNLDRFGGSVSSHSSVWMCQLDWLDSVNVMMADQGQDVVKFIEENKM